MNIVEKLKLNLGELVIDEEEVLLKYSKDSSDHPPKKPLAVIVPRNLNELARAVEFLYSERVPITPRGSGTSLTGGSIPCENGVVVSLERMNGIKDIDLENLTITVEPGVITKELSRAVEEFNLFYPPDPASLETCSVGGNVAENAGGPRAFKYGTTKHYVLELEVLVKNGSLVRLGKKTKKWVVGYDLPMLFCGSEGTLGIISEVTLRLIPKPPRFLTLLSLFPDEISAGRAVSEIIRSSLFPTCIEFVDHKCIEAIRKEFKENLPRDAGSFLIIEYDGFGPEFEVQVEKTYEILNKNSCLEVYLAEDFTTRDRIWKIRRSVLPILESLGKRIRHEDVVVPRSRIPELLELVKRVEERTNLFIASFGHAADGNIHINVLYENGMEYLMEKACDMIFEGVMSMGGTSAGEHGIGLLKKKYLRMEIPRFLIEVQKDVKRVFDPHNLFNPDKVF